MNYALLVTCAPASGQGALTAARFARAAIARGHSVQRVFFLDIGVGNGAVTPVYPQDEMDRLEPWVDIAREHGVELVLCVASALRHGVLDDTEARRHERAAVTAHPAFIVSGLGQLVDALASADRVISFGN